MKHNRSGVILADAVIGIIIAAGLTVTAASTVAWQRRASREMNDLRVATDLAESTLIDLHQGAVPAPAVPGQSVKIQAVSGGTAIPGFSWCRVNATVNGHSVSLAGLRADQEAGK